MNVADYELRTVTPLGVWLWDAVTDAPVLDRLGVVAFPLDEPGPERTAVVTPSGVRAFSGLAGLRRIEYPQGDEDPLTAPILSRTFAVTVDDTAGRFNPTVLVLTAPQRGPATLDGLGSPPAAPRRGPIYLFSAPSRRFPPGVAVVRADLVDRGTGEPAAHARLDVVVAGRRWTGIASSEGAVAVGFPYPGFGGAPPPSPSPGTGGTPPSQQAWEARIEVRHDPAALDFPLLGRPPDLASIAAQAPVDVWSDVGGPPLPALTTTLHYGAELVLKTAGEPSLLTGGTSP